MIIEQDRVSPSPFWQTPPKPLQIEEILFGPRTELPLAFQDLVTFVDDLHYCVARPRRLIRRYAATADSRERDPVEFPDRKRDIWREPTPRRARFGPLGRAVYVAIRYFRVFIRISITSTSQSLAPRRHITQRGRYRCGTTPRPRPRLPLVLPGAWARDLVPNEPLIASSARIRLSKHNRQARRREREKADFRGVVFFHIISPYDVDRLTAAMRMEVRSAVAKLSNIIFL